MIKSNFNAEKAAKRKELEQNPKFGNLFNLELEINRFRKALLTLYPESYKDWSKGDGITHHCILRTKTKEIPIYFSKYTPDTIYRDSDKKGLFCVGTLFGHFCGNTLTVYENIYDVLFTITINDKDFILNNKEGIRKVEYKNELYQFWSAKEQKNITYRDSFNYFQMKSLVAQAAFANKTIAASLGGKAKAAKQSGYKQVGMMFQNKNGECPAEETKSVIDAYKICAKYTKSRKGGGAISLRDFRRKIPAVVADMYDGYKIDCGKFLIYLSFGVSAPSGDECPPAVVNNTIYKITNKKINNLNNVDKVNGLTTLAGHSVPQMDKPSKDNHKKTTRRSKNLPCGHKACPINSLLKINKLVKVEKWRKYNQIIMEMVSY